MVSSLSHPGCARWCMRPPQSPHWTPSRAVLHWSYGALPNNAAHFISVVLLRVVLGRPLFPRLSGDPESGLFLRGWLGSFLTHGDSHIKVVSIVYLILSDLCTSHRLQILLLYSLFCSGSLDTYKHICCSQASNCYIKSNQKPYCFSDICFVLYL